ncbi:MAG: hypothetical protein ABI488_05735 [Polyangiaceae bacterium]
MSKPAPTAYPFMTKKQIQARIVAEPAFMMECASVMQARTEQRAAGLAPPGKPWGWMSSERVVAGKLTAKSKIGMLSLDEEQRLAKLVSRYSRQLADHHRTIALAENAGLAGAAEKFGVLPGGPTPSDDFQGPRQPQGGPERCHPSGERRPDAPEDDLEVLTEDDLEPDSEAVHDDPLPRRAMDFVERMPGQRTEAIADALGVTTALLSPALRGLVQGRRLRKQGFGRGTRYFPR